MRWPAYLPLTPSHFPLLPLATLALLAGCETAPPPVATPPIAKESSPQEPAPARIEDRTFDDIKFDIEPDAPFDRSMLTEEVRQLDGERIRIRGYILPTSQARGIKNFVLVRDNQECCFGPGAALYDCILVTMQGDKSAEFSVRPVAVEGKFKVEEFYGPDDKPLAIYRLDGEAVK
ncbi:DUF3299 domain-containing protein [Botrimarina mediterranea]|uniref:DUF3299 domain-containing protein n=1 Tax=Botrimarina mediterranea TaxID=2528022 RepID=UPI003AF32BBF